MDAKQSMIDYCPSKTDVELLNSVLAVADAYMMLGVILGLLAYWLIPKVFLFIFWFLYHKLGWSFLNHRYELKKQFRDCGCE